MESRTSLVSRKTVMVINFAQSRGFINFHASSQKFKILSIPNALRSHTSMV
ncbi:hypothetical protein B296_00004483 [Ensete ventricosum]|uniref:Uncharacterized protein n=1 Tax=Ensete ventricosum TaxID=4639 RepID=A0A427A2J4_ENSVE|nr:hypothetical protein B296_00004483 [Ensete ventricosum]